MQQKRQEKHDNVYRESVSHVFPKFENVNFLHMHESENAKWPMMAYDQISPP